MKIKKKLRVLYFFVVLLPACITYRNFPDVTNVSLPKKQETLLYKIEGGGMFAGENAASEAIENKSGYEKVVKVDTKSSTGTFLHVDIQQIAPSISAAIFGYISYATLTILPFWSTEDGTKVSSKLFKNGREISFKECSFNRSTFVWLPIISFSWLNKNSHTEADAIKACIIDFFRNKT